MFQQRFSELALSHDGGRRRDDLVAAVAHGCYFAGDRELHGPVERLLVAVGFGLA